MSGRSVKPSQILDVTERLVRTRGYNGFSFRDVAAAVGIKSASVHYHFPTKADLGVAVARRYTERFLAGLGDPRDPAPAPADLLDGYLGLFRQALGGASGETGQMCLCGMLGAEADALPAPVAAEAARFFERNAVWLAVVLSRLAPAPDPAALRRRALFILATLEGALILARSLREPTVFDEAFAAISPSAMAGP